MKRPRQYQSLIRNNVKSLREQAFPGMKVPEFARRFKVSRAQMYLWERGGRISLETAVWFMDVVNRYSDEIEITLDDVIELRG